MKTIRVRTAPAAGTLIAMLVSSAHLVAAGEQITVATRSHRSNVAEAILWSRLAPENGKPFTDPFAKLSTDQLDDLSYVMRVRRLIADDKISADGEDAKEAAKLAGKLQQQGVDIAWLMVQRGRVQQIRGIQVESLAKSIGESLRDRKVTLTGYVIPCKVNEGRLTEFFLVPTVAACSHEAAPPRLQVVFVSTARGIETPEKAMPVRVTGTVTAQTTKRTTVNGAGKMTIRSAYAMLSSSVETYQQAEHLEKTNTKNLSSTKSN